MKNIILFILVFVTSSCSFVPETPFDLLSSQNTSTALAEMERRYPYWNMKLSRFGVDDKDSGELGGPVSSDPEKNKNARILTIRSKEIMLERLNNLKFVINTPEFADLLRTKTFYSSRNGSSIKLGEAMDSERLLKVVQKVAFSSAIIKTQVISGGAAHGSVGGFIYEASDAGLANVSSGGFYVAFPNRWHWEDLKVYEGTWLEEGLFHEFLHNLGFNHNVKNDATYGMQDVFSKTYNDPKWQRKYRQQLASFQYYTKKYSHYLLADSLAVPKKQLNDTDLFTADQTRSENTHSNEIEVVCVLYPDGTHKLVKMQNGRMI